MGAELRGAGVAHSREGDQGDAAGVAYECGDGVCVGVCTVYGEYEYGIMVK